MNCLLEAIGLALPGNGTTLATHAARRGLFEHAGAAIVGIARRYYADDDESVLPRAVASRDAFENAMALDVAMGGSTNTILHLLAAAHEGGVDFGLKEIDELSRRVPCLCKVAPSSNYHVEDVHRAGGIPSILGELDRAGLLNTSVRTVHSETLRDFIDAWDLRSDSVRDEAVELYHAAPGGIRTTKPYSQSARWENLDTDREGGCIRDVEARLHRGRRPGRALRQPGPRRRDRQDGRRPGGTVPVRGDRTGLRKPGSSRGRHPQRRRQRGRRRGDPV